MGHDTWPKEAGAPSQVHVTTDPFFKYGGESRGPQIVGLVFGFPDPPYQDGSQA